MDIFQDENGIYVKRPDFGKDYLVRTLVEEEGGGDILIGYWKLKDGPLEEI